MIALHLAFLALMELHIIPFITPLSDRIMANIRRCGISSVEPLKILDYGRRMVLLP